jgi:hypothetical protein
MSRIALLTAFVAATVLGTAVSAQARFGNQPANTVTSNQPHFGNQPGNTVNGTQPQSTSAGMSKTTTMARNNIFKNIKLHNLFEKDLRVEMEIVKLMNEGQGNSARAQALRAEDLKLANELRKLGFTGN